MDQITRPASSLPDESLVVDVQSDLFISAAEPQRAVITLGVSVGIRLTIPLHAATPQGFFFIFIFFIYK